LSIFQKSNKIYFLTLPSSLRRGIKGVVLIRLKLFQHLSSIPAYRQAGSPQRGEEERIVS